MINGHSQRRVEEAVRHIKRENQDAQVPGVAADLGTKEGVDLLTGMVLALDILVNNLGIFESKPFPDMPDEDWQRFFEVTASRPSSSVIRHRPTAISRINRQSRRTKTEHAE